MAKSKMVKLGSVLTKKAESGGGTVIKTAVALTATLHDGEIVEIPAGSYVNVDDPRTLPDRLLKAGAINEDIADKMRERAAQTPDFVKYDLTVRR